MLRASSMGIEGIGGQKVHAGQSTRSHDVLLLQQDNNDGGHVFTTVPYVEVIEKNDLGRGMDGNLLIVLKSSTTVYLAATVLLFSRLAARTILLR